MRILRVWKAFLGCTGWLVGFGDYRRHACAGVLASQYVTAQASEGPRKTTPYLTKYESDGLRRHVSQQQLERKACAVLNPRGADPGRAGLAD